mmetsp:Transcript_74598/g.207339  ORF Transcript_74598/g.207339 Transcript_74598/m.207339 type:complete len:309 (+) Transcript_74598:940-1866(+)
MRHAASTPNAKTSASPAWIWLNNSRERFECSTPLKSSISLSLGTWWAGTASSPRATSPSRLSVTSGRGCSASRRRALIAAVVACRASDRLPSAYKSLAADLAACTASHMGGTGGASPTSSFNHDRACPSAPPDDFKGTSTSLPSSSSTSPSPKSPSAVSTRRSPAVSPTRIRSRGGCCRAPLRSALASSGALTILRRGWSSRNSARRRDVGLPGDGAAAVVRPPTLSADGTAKALPSLVSPSAGATAAAAASVASAASTLESAAIAPVATSLASAGKRRTNGSGSLPNHFCQPSSGTPWHSSDFKLGL